jgi:hypothetical protein
MKIKMLFLILLSVFSISLIYANKNLLKRNNMAQYDYYEVVGDWNIPMAKGYRDMAGLGYITNESMKSQLKEIKKKGNVDKTKISYLVNYIFKVLGWKHVATFTGTTENYDYCWTVLKNVTNKKIIFTFSGTKGPYQLSSQAWNSGGESYFREADSKIKIMKYFHKLYQTIAFDFFETFDRIKYEEFKQYIFVGHSLGGAMASIALFDLVRQGKLAPVTSGIKSPVLITYGQPRTGNYMFANELSKYAPIIFRHVNDNDLVPGIPECQRLTKKCVNEFSKTSIDSSETNYNLANISDSYYPWHLPGLIFIDGDDEKKDVHPNCITQSENPAPGCVPNTSLSFDFHKYYFGYKISDLWKPEVYNLKNTPIGRNSSTTTSFLTRNPPKNVWQEALASSNSYTSYIAGSISRAVLWGVQTAGLSSRKKK